MERVGLRPEARGAGDISHGGLSQAAWPGRAYSPA
jgi:hypothetical protein